MKNPKVELKVALLGNVSAGKSTVLNALLGGKYSEVGMRRTTAGVNFFRLHSVGSWQAEQADDEDSWGSEPSTLHDADSTLQQICHANATFRQGNEAHESSFDIEIDEPLCEMRKDTKLVLVDLPGLDDADRKEIHQSYVTEKWDTFDCAIVVVDVVRAVNTEEQVQILEFVNENLQTKRSIPVIVLCNKVDDPSDDEVQMLVSEVRSKVDEALVAAASVEFVAVSAKKAFESWSDSRMSFDDFQNQDIVKYDQIGREEVGRVTWEACNLREKYEIAYRAVQYQCITKQSRYNFQAFLDTLNASIGGNDVQLRLLEQQCQVAAKRVTFDTGILAPLQEVSRKRLYLGLPDLCLSKEFWRAYLSSCQASINRYMEDMDWSGMQAAMAELIGYDRYLCLETTGTSTQERAKVAFMMKSLVDTQISFFVQKAKEVDRVKGGFLFPDPPSTAKYVYNIAKVGCFVVAAVAAPIVVGGSMIFSEVRNIFTDAVHTVVGPPMRWFGWSDNKAAPADTNGPSTPPVDLKWDDLSAHDMSVVCESILEQSTAHEGDAFREQLLKLQDIRKRHRVFEHLSGPINSDTPKVVFTSARTTPDFSLPECTERYGKVGGKDYVRVDTNVKHEKNLSIPFHPSNPNHWGHLVWLYNEHQKAQKGSFVA